MASPRDIPPWLRTIINVVAFIGVGASLMGRIQKGVGEAILICAPLYFAWEIYPWTAAQVRRRPPVTLVIFIVAGAALGAIAWFAVKQMASPSSAPGSGVTVTGTVTFANPAPASDHPSPPTAPSTPTGSLPIGSTGAASPKPPSSDPVGNLTRLGWGVKRDRGIIQFEVSDAPLPDMQESAKFFRDMREPFRLSFQRVPNLHGLNELSSIAECKELQILASDLPNVDELRGFGSLTKLMLGQVPLNSNNILDISALKSLTSLESLSLGGSRVTSLESIAGMHHLSTLNITSTLIRDLSPAKQLTELKNVDLSGTKIVDLSPLAASQGLEELGIDGKQTGSLASLSTATKLKQIRVIDNGAVDFAPLGFLPQLESIFILSAPRVDLTFLRKLPNLTNLQITGLGPPFGERTAVVDPAAICALGGPKTLTLGAVQLSSLGFLSGCTKLSELGLNSMPISSLNELSGMNTLKKVSLIRIPVVEISPLLSVPNLESVNLMGVPARADVISELSRRGVKVTNP